MDKKDLIFTHIENKKPSKSGWYLGLECAGRLKDEWTLWEAYWDKERERFTTDPKSPVALKIDHWLDPKLAGSKRA
jgi:hypothetical protein